MKRRPPPVEVMTAEEEVAALREALMNAERENGQLKVERASLIKQLNALSCRLLDVLAELEQAKAGGGS